MPSSIYVNTPPSCLPPSNITMSSAGSGYNTGNWTYSTTANSYLTAGGAGSTVWTTAASQGTTVGHDGIVEVKGENADIKINGKSLVQFMETMEKRLAILQPDLEKLEHFAALRKAYDNYKMLEALCELPKKEDEDA